MAFFVRHRSSRRIRRAGFLSGLAVLASLLTAGPTLAGHYVPMPPGPPPASPGTITSDLVQNYRQTISAAACGASGRVTGTHRPPLPVPGPGLSCTPPAFLPGTAATIGGAGPIPPGSGVANITSVFGPSDFTVGATLTGIVCTAAFAGCPGLGAPYDPAPAGNDVQLRMRVRLNDHDNCAPAPCATPPPGGVGVAGTAADFDLVFPFNCTPPGPPGPPATCGLASSVNAVYGAGSIAAGGALVMQVHRFRVRDSGMDGMLGTAGDNREFAMSGLFSP
jgi:hypothetical protein